MKKSKTILGFAGAATFLALVFVAWVYPEVKTASYVFGGLLVGILVALAVLNQRELKSAVHTRSLRYSANAAMTLALVLSIVGVVNFLNAKHFYRKDLTRDQLHGASEQTIKLLQELPQGAKFTVFTKSEERLVVKDTLENYTYYNPKIEVEYVDPIRDPARTQAAGVKKVPSVMVTLDGRTTLVDEITEEKLTNAFVKLTKKNKTTVCFIEGHGERSLEGTDESGYAALKQGITAQSYDVRTLNLFQQFKELNQCSVALVLGPTKAFFEEELKVFRAWLGNGGRALIAVDIDMKKGAIASPEMEKILSEWSIALQKNLVLDPFNTQLGVSPAIPLAAAYNKEHAITKDFQVASFFPLTSSLELKATTDSKLKVSWLAKSTDAAVAKNDFKEVATGQVKIDPAKDKKGPFILMASAEKDATRIIAMGTSVLASNQYMRNGANSDLFLNAVSWLANDENLISIRPKEESAQAGNLTAVETRFIGLFTKFMVPLSSMVMGVVVWRRRKSL